MADQTGGRTIALITGANGGMGQACAREFGRRHELILNDIKPDLTGFAEALQSDGFTVKATVVGDIRDGQVLNRITTAIGGPGRLGAVVHTAGISPSMGDWKDVIEINLVGTARLVEAIEPFLAPGTAAVLIASMAGHNGGLSAEIEAVLEEPLAPDILQRIEPHVEALLAKYPGIAASGPAYVLSKRGVIRLCQMKAREWAAKGARITSISPGVIWTPMGRMEAEDGRPAASGLAGTPMGRWGTALEIASAAAFLASDLAGFITGTDLLVDGGAMSTGRRPGG